MPCQPYDPTQDDDEKDGTEDTTSWPDPDAAYKADLEDAIGDEK